MPSARMRRVNEAVKEVLSAQLVAGLKDPRIGFVTVTGVETTPDLRNARVFFSVLGDDAARDDAMAGLRHSRGYLQSVINSELRMKRTPSLEFVYDSTSERAERLSRLIEESLPDRQEDDQ
ncbi:MAG: ribosome-binding factor [Thermoleophilaceae bacterium]|nr:ribosome-binding factor [Thermoleophilaceae bacterium]